MGERDVRTVVTRGLPLLAVLLLIGGCAAGSGGPCGTPIPCDPCAEPCPPPCPSPCPPPPPSGEWPNACNNPLTAGGMLNQILFLATEAHGQPEMIDPGDYQAIQAEVQRCLDPGLVTVTLPPVPVLDVTDPDPCAVLRAIYDRANEENQPDPVPAAGQIIPPEEMAKRLATGSRNRWHTIAQELQNFPQGPAQPPPQ